MKLAISHCGTVENIHRVYKVKRIASCAQPSRAFLACVGQNRLITRTLISITPLPVPSIVSDSCDTYNPDNVAYQSQMKSVLPSRSPAYSHHVVLHNLFPSQVQVLPADQLRTPAPLLFRPHKRVKGLAQILVELGAHLALADPDLDSHISNLGAEQGCTSASQRT